MAGQEIDFTKLTVTQSKIVRILLDGQRHTRQELLTQCLPTSELTTVKIHISKVRKALPENIAIICELWCGGIFYRLIRVQSFTGN